MNYLKDFNRGMTIEEYKNILGDQLAVHDLHFKKVDANGGFDLADDLKILVITETWCGDSMAILPAIQKLFLHSNVEIRILLRDENLELIDQFLTNGSRGIPIFLLLDKDGNFLMRFGPRPKVTSDMFESYRGDIKSGEIEKSEVLRKIRNFYSRDRGKAILEEFTSDLNKILNIG